MPSSMELARGVKRYTRARYTEIRGQASRLNSLLRPRRFHAYCVGIAKSGTHSIAGLFDRNYRAAHEPEDNLLVDTLIAASAKAIDAKGLAEFVRTRDRRLRIELDSSALNYFLLDILLDEFPDARFILTIRDCYSWLDSFLNHQLAVPANENWQKFRDLRFRPGQMTFEKAEQILAERGLYTLDAYLSYWVAHNKSVLSIVPKDRLFVVRTRDIARRSADIAAFLGIPAGTLDASKSHSYGAVRKFGLLAKMDRDFVEDKVQSHCGELMDQFFPDVRCLSDVVKSESPKPILQATTPAVAHNVR